MEKRTFVEWLKYKPSEHINKDKNVDESDDLTIHYFEYFLFK